MFGTKCEWLLSLYERVGYDILLWFLLSTPSSNKRSVENTMGEVMICRGGRGSGAGGSSNKNYGEGGGTLTTLVFTDNEVWTVPSNIVDNWVSVRLFGGGADGYVSNINNIQRSEIVGGGSGWMNNDILKLSSGEVINITIGKNGNTAGGTTSFGGYLSANGAWMSSGGAGGGVYNSLGNNACKGYQFGGGGLSPRSYSGYTGRGDGGVWGGGGGGQNSGGNGGIYGGGGGIGYGIGYDNNYAGNGGKYGGGGGGGAYTLNTLGIGGEFGGNGGGCGGRNIVYISSSTFANKQFLNSENGTNTIGWQNVEVNSLNNNYITGNGLSLPIPELTPDWQKGKYVLSGGGGFGGCGGGGGGYYWNEPHGGGGGGGYGGHGGHGGRFGGGGGGGFGGNGGNVYTKLFGYNETDIAEYVSAGGGGYHSNGGNADESYFCGGGGGYYDDGSSSGGAGGFVFKGTRYAYGGNAIINNNNGGSGICIIQFYRNL